jgi:hypothetical protein
LIKCLINKNNSTVIIVTISIRKIRTGFIKKNAIVSTIENPKVSQKVLAFMFNSTEARQKEKPQTTRICRANRFIGIVFPKMKQ